MSTKSILPDNRTTLEAALEQTLSDSLLAIDSPYPQLWNPETVSPHMLPYLAHAKGVTDWGAEADEAARRHTVAHVWPVQRQAGTKQGVEDAVDGLGLNAEFIPGYSWGGPAYSFRVDLIGGLRGVPVRRIQQRIEVAKAERDGYSIRAVYRPRQDLFIGGVVHESSCITVNYQPPGQRVADGVLFVGGVVHESSRITVSYQPPEQRVRSRALYRGVVIHAVRRIIIS